MRIGYYRFDRVEFAGSLGDLGTLIPLTVALIVINGLSVTTVLMMIGLFYIATGLYYRLPVPVQPLKVVAAIAIAFPEKISIQLIAASGILIGVILLLLAATGLINWLARFFTKSIVRGIQLGLGLVLISKGIEFIGKTELFILKSDISNNIAGLPLNLVIGAISVLVVLFLLSNKRFPAALVIVITGIITGILLGALRDVKLVLGPTPVEIIRLNTSDLINALILLVIPQLPLTLGNAIMGTTDACKNLFGEGKETKRATHRGFSVSMGLVNIITGMIGGVPVCHGAGGLAAHYRFGARTGGSNIMIGTVFLVIALVFGRSSIFLLASVPNAILGTLLLFAGLELALLILDVKDKKDMFVVFLVAGIGFVTTNMGIAFFLGIIIDRLMRWKDIRI